MGAATTDGGGACQPSAADVIRDAAAAPWRPAMAAAVDLARRAAAAGEVPVGALVLASDGQVLAAAHNAREATHDPLGHAEVLAIRAAAARLGRWRLSGCTLVVTLEPCAMCAGAIVLARLDRVVYGAADLRAGAVGSRLDLVRHADLNHRAEVVAGVAAATCGALLTNFFAARRRARAPRRPGAGPGARPCL